MERRTVFQTKTKSMEWLLSLMMISWAVTLALPGDTLSLAPYKEFTKLGLNDTNLCILYGSLGTIRMITLFQNGNVSTGPAIRLVCSFLAAFTWLTMSALILITHLKYKIPLSAICGQTLVLFLGELYTVGVAAVDRRIARN